MNPLRDHAHPCEHNLKAYQAAGTWLCRAAACPGGQAVTAHPMIVMGGLTPAWYPAGDEDPDGWLVEAQP